MSGFGRSLKNAETNCLPKSKSIYSGMISGGLLGRTPRHSVYFSPYLKPYPLCLGHDFGLIHRKQPSIFQDLPPVHPDESYVASPSRIDDMADRVIHGHQMRLIEAEGDQVGLFAWFYAPGLISQPKGESASECRHPEHLLGGAGEGVFSKNLMDFGCKAHFGKKVQVVVACASVSPEANRYPGGDHVRDGGDAGAQLHRALRAMGH